MYIWKTSKLIDDLKHNRLTSQNFKNYYIVSSLLTLFGMYAIRLSPNHNALFASIEFAINAGILIIGVNMLFIANQRNAGKDFVNRIISLMLPISIKITVLSSICYILIIAILQFLNNTEQHLEKMASLVEWQSIIFSISIQALILWRLYVALKKINDPSTSPAV